MKNQDIITQARQGFDSQLHTAGYRKIHSDQAHLEALMQFLEIQPAGHYIDLGTGNGYLTFEMARRFPEIFVTGVDIATMHDPDFLVLEKVDWSVAPGEF